MLNYSQTLESLVSQAREIISIEKLCSHICAKVTLEAIARNIALEFARFGIKANCIQAGVTDTGSLRMIPSSDEIKKQSISRNPFGRLTLPEDIANVVYLPAKDEAAWINGTIIQVDGGEHLK